MNTKGVLVRDCSVCKARMGLRSLHPPESRLRERLSGQGWGPSQRLAGPALPDATPTQPSSPSPLPGSAWQCLCPPQPPWTPLGLLCFITSHHPCPLPPGKAWQGWQVESLAVPKGGTLLVLGPEWLPGAERAREPTTETGKAAVLCRR